MKHNTRYKEEVVVKTKSPLIRKKKTNDLIHSENSLKRPSTRTSITAVDTPLKQRNISQKGNKAISELKDSVSNLYFSISTLCIESDLSNKLLFSL